MGALLLFASCATYQKRQESARDQLRQKQYAAAVSQLQVEAEKPGDDQLVYVLDYATALQISGQYGESNKWFAKAEEISSIQDYTSLSREVGAIVLNEEMVQYKGEDFELIMINALAALNYLELGSLDSALVEVRRLNNKLYRYRTEAKRNYDENPFAFYLAGVLWEADRKWDDAYIAYKNAYQRIPDFEPLHKDLIRLSKKAQRLDDHDKWRKMFPGLEVPKEASDPKFGEVVFVYQQGWGPRKAPRPENFRFPRLVPVGSETKKARLVLKSSAARGDDPREERAMETGGIFNLQQLAIQSLEDQFGSLVARRIGGIVAKEVLADQIRQKNELLGAVAWVALHATDRADLRQWSTLPETLQMARAYVPVGEYDAQAVGLRGDGNTSGELGESRPVKVLPGKKTFVTWRSLQ